MTLRTAHCAADTAITTAAAHHLRALHQTSNKITAFQHHQQLLRFALEYPESVSTAVLRTFASANQTLFDQPSTLHCVATLLDAAITSQHAIQPTTVSALCTMLRGILLSGTIEQHGCILKVVRGLLKHRMIFSLASTEFQVLLTTVTSLNFAALSVHSQIQLLKTIHTMLEIAFEQPSVGHCCGKDLYRIVCEQGPLVWKICCSNKRRC